jgi:TetR/AcrR family transcriptional repressor of nem operon
MARPRRSQQTRERLLEHGLRLLTELGFHGTGLAPLLARVGVPKGSFYNFFRSKEDFCAEVVRHYGRAVERQLDEAVRDAETDAAAALRAWFHGRGREFEAQDWRGGCLLGNLAGELEDSEVCRRALAETIEGWRDRLDRILALAQQQGTVRTDVPSAELADVLLAAWEGAILRMKIARSPEPLQQFARRVLDDALLPR